MAEYSCSSALRGKEAKEVVDNTLKRLYSDFASKVRLLTISIFVMIQNIINRASFSY